MKIINLLEYKSKKEEETRIKVEAQQKIREMRHCGNRDEFDLMFYELVDIFFSRYPGMLSEFDKFYNENWRKE